MTLSQEDGQLYYRLWLPLLDFVNRKYRVSSKLKNITEKKGLDPSEVKKAADRLWSDVTAIEDYLKANDDLPEEYKEIVRSWKQVYQVSGIISSWEEMFYGAPMPLILEATFMPFRDVIISDGLVMPYNVIVGGGMKRMFKDVYMNAKKSGRIHQSL